MPWATASLGSSPSSQRITERSWTPSDQSAFSFERITPEVLAVAVDAGHLAELARVDELLHLAEARVVEEQVPGHQHEAALLRQRDELLHLARPHRRRLLDEHVLARLERLLRERVVRRHGRRDDDRVDGCRRRAGRRSRRSSRAAGSAPRTAARSSSSVSQIHASSASSPTTRTTFLPQPPTPAWATRVTASRPSRS